MFLHRYLGFFRALLVGFGLTLFVAGLNTVASTPTPPPESDGFLKGLAYIYALLVGVTGLLVVQIGYALPAGTGWLRTGPLADRSVGTRGVAVVLVYMLMVLLMVYGIPRLVPSVTESTAYATGLFIFGIASGVGGVLALLFVLGGLITRHIPWRRR